MKITDVLKKIDGNLLLISNDSKYFDIVSDNKNISESYVLSNNGGRGKKFNLKNKKIHIKKIKKYFNKKSVDNLVVDYSLVKDYLKYFIGSSIYINRGKLYFYNVERANELTARYSRYGSLVTNDELLIIDNKNAKSNFFKDFYFNILNKKEKIVDKIVDLLTS